MRTLVRAVGLLGVTALTWAALSIPAGAAGVVGPKQFFTGVINGKDGNTTIPITIKMDCFGPVYPGQTGHPMGGQTLAVHQLFPPSSTTGSLGETGGDSTIGVFFGAPPPAASVGPAAEETLVFTRYDKPKPLPTSLTLPCGGTGTVWFSPIPVVPPSRSASVPVDFVGQP
jgi:hypothetical protein